MRFVAGIFLLVFATSTASDAVSKPKLISTHKDWSTYCKNGVCWATHEFGSAKKYWISTLVRESGRYETSILPDDRRFTASDSVSFNVAGKPMYPGFFNGGIVHVSDYSDQLSISSQMRQGASATATINNRREDISLSGYTAALKKAHTANGVAYNSSVFSGGQIQLGGRQSSPKSGCTIADVEAGTGAIANAAGQPPEAGTGILLYWQRRLLTKSLNFLNEFQRKCPSLDLSLQVNYVQNGLNTTNEALRAVGLN